LAMAPEIAAVAASVAAGICCTRESSGRSMSARCCVAAAFNTTSFVCAANPENSARTTYRPNAGSGSSKLPSMSVDVVYLRPVIVFAAVTDTPGNGDFPDVILPAMVPFTAGVAAVGAAAVGAGAAGAGCRVVCAQAALAKRRVVAQVMRECDNVRPQWVLAD
jgi:hypothetical protein